MKKKGIGIKRRIIAAILVYIMILTVVLPVQASVELPTQGRSLEGETIIIHTNDTHGRAAADSANRVMGFSTVSALKKAYETSGATVLLVDAGDTLHGLPFATVSKGVGVVELMNLAGYDAMTPGNHDFNYGVSYLKELSGKMQFPLLSANIVEKSTKNLLFQASAVVEKNGVRYGIFGLTTPETTYKTNPANVEGVKFTNPVEAAKGEVKALEEQGADYIIAVAHMGLEPGSQYTSEMIAQQVEGIDVIIDGHSHTLLPEGKLVNSTMIAGAGEYLNQIGVVEIKADGTIQAGLVTEQEFSKRDFAIDAAAEKVLEEQKQLLEEVQGSTLVNLDGERESVRREETNLGNLVADAVRDETGADVALINGGGIRASIVAGEITRNDLVSVFPFGNYIVTKKISGKSLLEALEHSVSNVPDLSGGFLQVSGLTFTFDSSKPAGSRVAEVNVGDKPLDTAGTYELATIDYIAAGGDEYTMIADAPLSHEYSSLEECMIRYLNQIGTVDIREEGRIVNLAPAENSTSQNGTTQNGTTQNGTTQNGTLQNGTTQNGTAQGGTQQNDTPQTSAQQKIYTVKTGDTLRTIAGAQLGDGNRWRDIYQWNKEIIKNPDVIRRGWKLKIIYP